MKRVFLCSLAVLASPLLMTESIAQFRGLSPLERGLIVGLGVGNVSNRDFAGAMFALNALDRDRIMRQQRFIRQDRLALRAQMEQDRLRGVMTQRFDGRRPSGRFDPMVEEPPSDVLLVWEVMGATFQPVEPSAMAAISSEFDGGLRVLAVGVGSAADRAGWRAGDILVGLHRYRMRTYDNVAFIAELPEAAHEPILSIRLRNGETIRSTLDLSPSTQQATAQPKTAAKTVSASNGSPPEATRIADTVWERLGVRVLPITLSAPRGGFTAGLRVTEVRESSPAHKSGWKVGDVILGLGGFQMQKAADLGFVLADVGASGGPVPYVLWTEKEIRRDTLDISPEPGAAEKTPVGEGVPLDETPSDR